MNSDLNTRMKTDSIVRSKAETQEIVIDEILPHSPETIWKTLTTGELIGRWLMEATGFEPVKGKRFTFQTSPGGRWDGVIHCQVLEVTPNQRLAYAWKGGHEDNIGYGAPLDTVVTWTLFKVDGGTRLRLVHSGFVAPRNDTAFKTMSGGWSKVVQEIGKLAGTYTGGCACGAIRYEITGEPLFSNECQCRDCQRISGTGHGSYLTFLRKDVKQKGGAGHWDIIADSGSVKTRAFCPTCGSPVAMTFSAAPDAFAVHAGSLDDPGRFKPQAVTYRSKGHAWDHLDPALPTFETMPPT